MTTSILLIPLLLTASTLFFPCDDCNPDPPAKTDHLAASVGHRSQYSYILYENHRRVFEGRCYLQASAAWEKSMDHLLTLQLQDFGSKTENSIRGIYLKLYDINIEGEPGHVSFRQSTTAAGEFQLYLVSENTERETVEATISGTIMNTIYT